MIINDAFFYSLQSTKTDTIMAATNEADGTDVSFFYVKLLSIYILNPFFRLPTN